MTISYRTVKTNLKTLAIINPASEKVIAELPENSSTEIAALYELAKMAQADWASTELKARIAIISSFRELLASEASNVCIDLTAETGKPLWQSHNELNGALSRIDFFIEQSEQFLAPERIVSAEGEWETISYEPLGVIGNISAWNYPLLVGVNVFIPALIAGNAVMYKPSEFATLTGRHIDRLMQAAGVSPNIFQFVIGGGNAGAALLDLSLDGYYFTGSNATGKRIYEQVAHKMVPCQLELGGKDPLYICDDVPDVAIAAESAVHGAFYHNGQSCCAVERIYVHHEIYSDFKTHFLKTLDILKQGDPEAEGVYFGPLTRNQQRSFLQQQIDDALSKGAHLERGGSTADRDGFFFQPTVLTNVDHTMSLMTEESFGPVIGIMQVNSDEEAIDLMNDTSYGLTSAVYSGSEQRAKSILSKLDSGTCYWNRCDRVSPFVPWSGRKNSGIGHTLSYHGIRAFTKMKAWQMKTSI